MLRRAKWLRTGVLLALGAALPAAARAAEPDRGTVYVRVFDTAGMPDLVLARAREVASEIYERAGIELTWVEGDAKTLREVERVPARPIPKNCPSVSTVDVRIRLAFQGRSSSVLAYAQPYHREGVRVTISTERVYAHARLTRMPVHYVLGVVLAHEVGHVLRATDGHSEEGLMSSHLPSSPEGFEARELTSFQPKDISLIRMNLRLSAEQAGCADMRAGLR